MPTAAMIATTRIPQNLDGDSATARPWNDKHPVGEPRQLSGKNNLRDVDRNNGRKALRAVETCCDHRIGHRDLTRYYDRDRHDHGCGPVAGAMTEQLAALSTPIRANAPVVMGMRRAS